MDAPSTENATREPLFDVVIYERDSRKVESIIGRDMRMDTGFHNANRLLGTAQERINDRYDAMIVPAGLYAVGDVVAAH